MENKELFISPRKNAEKLPRQYIKDELKADIDSFGNNKELISDFLGGRKLAPEDISRASKLRDEWWYNKYGFPFTMEIEKEAVLKRKYALTPEAKRTLGFQEEFMRALQENKKEKIKDVRERYEKEYPEQLEGVEALFALQELLAKQKALDNEEPWIRRSRDLFQDICESQFLITHFILLNRGNKNFLKDFWDVAEYLAKGAGTQKTLNSIRRGIVSQVAVYDILDQIKMSPRLSHPRQDAFEKTDIWIDKNVRVQIKGNQAIEKPALVKTDEVVFPGVLVRKESEAGEKDWYFNSRYAGQVAEFAAKIKKINPDAEGMFMVVPMHMIDFITGKPDGELVDFFRKKINPQAENIAA